jgi:hypothetical protein
MLRLSDMLSSPREPINMRQVRKGTRETPSRGDPFTARMPAAKEQRSSPTIGFSPARLLFTVIIATGLVLAQTNIVDLPPESTNPFEREAHKQRSRLFNVPGPFPPLDVDDAEPRDQRRPPKPPPLSYVTPMDLDELPVSESAVIIAGKVRAILPYLSEDRKSLYTEIYVDIEEAIKGTMIVRRSSVIFVRHGFSEGVRLANGRIIFAPTYGHGREVRSQGRYVFFGNPVPGGDAFGLVKVWELSSGVARPMAVHDMRRSEEGRSRYDGMNEVLFVRSVRAAAGARE